MPLFGRDRYQRLDGAGGGPGRKPSSFCSSATIVVFVALCLVAAWMMASSSNIPVSVSPAENKSEAKDEEDGSRATPIVKHDDSSVAVDDTPNAGDDNKGGEDDAGKKDESGSRGGGDASPINGDEGSGDKVDGGAGATKTPDDGSGGDIDTSPINGDEGSGDKGDGAGATKTPDDGSGGDTSPINGDEGSGDKSDGSGSGATKMPDDGSGSGNDNTTRSGVVAGTTNATGSGTTGGREGDDEAGSGNPATGAVAVEGDTPSRNQSFSDENGKTEDGDVAKPEDPEKKVEQSPEDATDDNKDTGGQETTLPDGSSGGGGMAKNQTSFGEEVGERSTEEPASKDRVRAVDDPTAGSGAAKNETLGEGSENTTATTTNTSRATADGKAELLPRGQADLLNETASAVAKNSSFPTQGSKSVEERKKKNKSKKKSKQGKGGGDGGSHVWKLCNVTAGADYIPCLDNEAAIRALKSTKHYEHRERHCPVAAPTCLVLLPAGYRQPIPWPHSRDKIWYHNVPHTMLASYKGHQNWVKVSGEYLTFPGGGTQFTHGALHYIELMEDALPEIAWGRRSRAVLDVGCGVASFGGFLFDKEALTMSFAPKDEHEAQVQFALERGIPAVSAVMGTLRLPFPGNVFDVVHCARCRVPWHIEGGKLLLEVNRLLRPGGLFIWSATPVYRKVPEDVQIWHAMDELTKSMCWEMLKRTSDTVDQTAMVVFKKPSSNDCYDARARVDPPLCEASDDQNAAWNVTLQACMHRVPTDASARGARWPAPWPERLSQTPYWLSESQTGVYGKPAPADFTADQEHWRSAVENSYLTGMGINWKNVRNIMDMRAVYGGFAAALRDMKVWVMNVVTVDSPDTLPIIYERGLFGMYHDWCESFSTYPRTYDLLHADHLFSRLRSRCKRLLPVMVEVDRILRPDGTLIVCDDKETAQEVRSVAESLHWELRMSVSRQGEELLCLRKTTWRPKEVEAIS